ncbi:phenylacetaldoxime dehydratase family protein [Aestuariivirga sp. YIM B02566]|uniref:Phenylacetaldoxime dehydratase family protein n=1 Tax=Taklimakanibacter albus TaxID=2800327 RepID=A0ACC5RD90_9HYPH|nr:phenylacetaldoxime dehydratase family protein [Aestuariivirga sp. YIM B02566]
MMPAQEMSRHLLGAVLLLAALSALPFLVTERYALGEFITFLIWASVAVQWNVLTGHAGVFSLGQMLFFAIGSYCVAMFAVYFGLPPWASMPVAGLAAGVAALLIGLACLRLAAAYVALLTFAIAYMVYTLIITDSACYITTGGTCTPFFGGTNGFSQFVDLGFRKLLKGNWIVGNYFSVLAVFALSFIASIIVIHGRLGLAFRATSDSAIYAAARGINRTKFQLIAFVVTAFFTGLAGASYAAHFRFAGPSLFELSTLMFVLSMVIVGGLKSTWGPIFGAALMMILVEVGKSMGDVRNTLIGLVLVIFVLLLPKGVAGAWAMLVDRLRRSHAASSGLEPAIPSHLQAPRTRPLAAPEGFVPATPSYSARFSPEVTALPMAFFGVQFSETSPASTSAIAFQQQGFAKPFGPSFWDRAEYVDERGCINSVLVGYWDDRQTYDRWCASLPEDWWRAGAPLDGALGFFRECYTPSIADTETTFSHPHPEGYATIATAMSGMTDTHGYWGSARDRIPRAQTDDLAPQGAPKAALAGSNDTLRRHIVVTPHDNLCLLRSGQDWTDTDAEERHFYLHSVKPKLDEGMEFIRDEGGRVGCYFNRYMTLCASAGPLDKTYSLSAWRSLGELEAWVKTDSHLAIFAAGTRHYRTFKDGRLRLYHEMSVIRAKDQSFEYFNCHDRTGMLNTLNRA